MQKIRKIFAAVSEKTALPTNKPIITNNTDFFWPGWRRSNKHNLRSSKHQNFLISKKLH